MSCLYSVARCQQLQYSDRSMAAVNVPCVLPFDVEIGESQAALGPKRLSGTSGYFVSKTI